MVSKTYSPQVDLDPFWAELPFPPDDFQHQAISAIAERKSVVVTAPTGAGKTLVAEGAIYQALARGKRAVYTTPLKALSNQKYQELSERYGPGQVGLVTGDNSINNGAEIVVMTTEILRNMIYVDPAALERVSIVILDEVHFLADPDRGAIWEEVIIHSPSHLQLVCLSATIANPKELVGWIRERRGPTELIISEQRPVPLENHMLIADRGRPRRTLLMPTFVHENGHRRPNRAIPTLLRANRRGQRKRYGTPRPKTAIKELHSRDLLPVIFFFFSRARCELEATRLAQSNLKLSNPESVDRAREVAERHTSALTQAELDSLGYQTWLENLSQGVSAHHAGMIPAFKEAVEELFCAGDLSVIFATETLSLGINMPARSVVLGSLTKYDGETHQLLEPGDYTQLTGRAGRRGIDQRGYGMVLYSPWVEWREVHQLVAPGSHPLLSSFRPTYNMAVNLIAKYTREEAEQLLEASLAEYQQRHRRSGRLSMLDWFDRLTELLNQWRYVQGWSLTSLGGRLRIIYNELDLALTESVEQGTWWKLTPVEMAALAVCFVYEPRRQAPEILPPEERSWVAGWEKILSISKQLNRDEAQLALTVTRSPCSDLAGAVWQWTQGGELDQIGLGEMAPGDFVRNVRQTIDLLKQLENAYPELRADLVQARKLLDRGVVASTRMN